MNEVYSIHEPSTEKKVSTFLQYYDSDKTRRNYQDALYRYFTRVYTVGENTLASLDAAAFAYLQELAAGRPVINDLYSAAGSFSGQYAPATANLYIRSICTWLNDCGIALTRRERQRVFNKIPPVESVRREAELTRSLFRAVYDRMTSEWARVLLLVMLGSGMRLSEALSLRISYVSWKKTYTEIFIPASDTKTKRSRVVYLTTEASLALKSYLESRKAESEFLFPYTCAAAERQMRFAADALASGKDKARIRAVHWHMTRKWFISRFSLYASRSVAEKLAGHEGYLTRSYHRFTKRQILGQFKKAERYLSILPPEQVQQVLQGPQGSAASPAENPGLAPAGKTSSASSGTGQQQETVLRGQLVRLESGKQVVLLDTGKYIVLNDDVTGDNVTNGFFPEKGTS
ncbi:MAG: tyrosine-type recombinase/integrase [Methanocorpusculum sp.]|nr:tyrosine-type recombinase/integrase [Methanocorpusculum sp.]